MSSTDIPSTDLHPHDESKDSSDSFEKNNTIRIKAAGKILNKRIRNKLHACTFCQKLIVNIGRHLSTKHSNESEVAKLLSLPNNSESRKAGFTDLLKVGDFYHNISVLSQKKGELILIRRPTKSEIKFKKYADYGPCPNCLGFLLKKHIWVHIKNNCNVKRNTGNIYDRTKNYVAESNAILNGMHGKPFTDEFISNIVSKLRDDEIGKTCTDDDLILQYGSMQFEKYGTTQCELTRQNMRQMGRLLIKLREIDKEGDGSKDLSIYINPGKFDLIIQATKLLCVTQAGTYQRPEFSIPSLALKIGHGIRKCAGYLRGTALRRQNSGEDNSIQSFLHLMDLEWSTRISSNALSTLHNRKLNSEELLPLTTDLMKLNKHINTSISSLVQEVKHACNQQAWNKLACLVLSRIILFNKRRSGEASKLTINQYLSKPSWTQGNEEIKKSLTPVETKLAERLGIVEILGKRGRKVHIILTPEAITAIDLLLMKRKEGNVDLENQFVFAYSNNSLGHLRGHDCVRKVTSEVDLKYPQRVSSTKLRKYVATVTQIMNLTENETDWLARHLGHDVRVHREFYRLHESTVELTKISRLLLAVDKGDVHKFAGCELKDIQIDGKFKIFVSLLAFRLSSACRLSRSRSLYMAFKFRLYGNMNKFVSQKQLVEIKGGNVNLL